MKNWKLIWVSLLFPLTAMAAEPTKWSIVPEESSIEFIAKQSDVPIKGKFTQYEADIQFDPKQLKDSKAIVKVKTDSATTALQDLTNNLKSEDWLFTKSFPEATFETVEFEKSNNEHYQARGNLTIRDKTFPANSDFEIVQFTPEKAEIKGTLNLKRTLWGVGQGEWKDTKDVKDDVKIIFDFKLVPKK